jgi:hypothetical protein
MMLQSLRNLMKTPHPVSSEARRVPGAHPDNLLLLRAQWMGVENDGFGDSNKVISL